jgi:ketosteroid isomerase-like protein
VTPPSGRTGRRQLAIIFTLRQGKLVHGEEYFDRAAALKAAGLRE